MRRSTCSCAPTGIGSRLRRRLLPDVARSTPATWPGGAWCPSATLDARDRRAARGRHHLLRVRQQPHPRVPDPRAGRIGRARASAWSTSSGTATTSPAVTSTTCCSDADGVTPRAVAAAGRGARRARRRAPGRRGEPGCRPPLAEVVVAHRAAVPAGDLRRRGAADGLRAGVPDRRRGVRRPSPRGRGHGQGGGRRLGPGRGAGRPTPTSTPRPAGVGAAASWPWAASCSTGRAASAPAPRSTGTWRPGDPELIFGLRPGRGE